MVFKPKRCPICRDEGAVDDQLLCSRCGNQLEYTDEQGTLGVEQKANRCTRCHTENNRQSTYCESCGSLLSKECPLCKGRHAISARVCSRYGEPLKAETSSHPPVTAIIKESFALALNRNKRFALAPLALLAVIAGFFFYTNFLSRSPGIVSHGGKPAIDVVFVVDTTGSMADELQVIKEKIKDMMAKIKSGQPVPDVRFGLIAYRDRGDDYIVKKFDFTENIDKFQNFLNTLTADGGGDTKEAVNEALDAALHEMAWDKNTNTRKLMFLIGDAGPHTDYNNGLDYRDLSVEARKNGIKIYSLGCSGIEEDGEPEFRYIAQTTGGTFEYLTYRHQFTDDSGATYYRLKAGKSYYSIDSKGDDWKDGVKSAIDRGMAKEVKAPAPSTAGSGSLVPGNAKASEAMPENNLDTVFTRTVQQNLEESGVKYKK